jgi:hypothetical protein
LRASGSDKNGEGLHTEGGSSLQGQLHGSAKSFDILSLPAMTCTGFILNFGQSPKPSGTLIKGSENP